MTAEIVIPDNTMEELAEKSAQLTLNGVGINQQAKDLSLEFNLPITRTKVVNLKKHPKYTEVLMKAAEAGKLQLKAGLSGIVPDLIACLGSAIKEGGTHGVRASAIAATILTDKDPSEGPKQAQAIQVILPGAPLPPKG